MTCKYGTGEPQERLNNVFYFGSTRLDKACFYIFRKEIETMRTIIAGSRHITDYSILERILLESGVISGISEIVSGGARGVDALGEAWGGAHGLPVRRFPADWKRFGRRAGYIRNAAMLDYADILILIWDGRSAGSRMMLRLAKKADIFTLSYVV